MRLFGKKANPQSEITDVPPELRPYYREQAIAAHAHRTALRFLTVFIIFMLVVGGGLWLWLHYKGRLAHVFGHHGTSTTQNQPNQVVTQGNTPASSPSPSATNTTTPSPTPTMTPSPSPSPSQAMPTSTPSPSPSPQQSPTPTAIPNTGPGSAMLFVALGIGVVAIVGYHLYQRRSARQ